MSAKWCIVVRPAETASSAQVASIAASFTRHGDRLDWRREGMDWLVHVDALDDPKAGEPAITEFLRRCGLESAVVTPFPLGHWSESLGRYVISGDLNHPAPSDPAVPADEITWVVSVQPASAFDWRAMRAELARRGRTILGETETAVEVGARDESEAHALIAELMTLPTVASADAKALTKLRRWKVRQQLLGNYEGPLDPTQLL